MNNTNDFNLTGPELHTELLKRMGYRDESRKCSNCCHYTGLMSKEECDLIPIMRLNIDEDGYCDYHKFKSE